MVNQDLCLLQCLSEFFNNCACRLAKYFPIKYWYAHLYLVFNVHVQNQSHALGHEEYELDSWLEFQCKLFVVKLFSHILSNIIFIILKFFKRWFDRLVFFYNVKVKKIHKFNLKILLKFWQSIVFLFIWINLHICIKWVLKANCMVLVFSSIIKDVLQKLWL